MTDVLLEYGLFLAQATTLVVAIIAVLLFGFALARRGGGEEQLEVRHMNERFDAMERQMRQATQSKYEFKADEKARRKTQKAEEKAKKKKHSKSDPDTLVEGDTRQRIFVLNFNGDIKASEVSSLREEITAILTLASTDDKVLLRLENAGGLVHEHGLAASQLLRIKARGIPLVVAVDKVAASGGYMMACVADHLIAAPFAILGSIGVLLQIPNFHRLLDSHGVDFEQIKGGKHKRTLTLFGENTEADRERAREEIEDVHRLFRGFVSEHRPKLDLDAVATGEHWYGVRAVELELCDELSTSDDYLLNASKEADLYELEYALPVPLGKKLAGVLESTADTVLSRHALRKRYGRLSI